VRLVVQTIPYTTVIRTNFLVGRTKGGYDKRAFI